MKLALEAANKARSKGDISIGSALIWPTTFFTEHNTVVTELDPISHAEINVLRKASDMMPRKRIKGATLYSTFEPCAMCAVAAYLNGINEIVFGCYDLEEGFISSGALNLESYGFTYRGGVLAKECFDMLPKDLKKRASLDGKEYAGNS